MEPSKAAIVAFQFVEADIVWSDAFKAFRKAPECKRIGMLYDDGSVRRHSCGTFSVCDACKVRDRLYADLKRAAKARKLARLRAIRAVRKEATR